MRAAQERVEAADLARAALAAQLVWQPCGGLTAGGRGADGPGGGGGRRRARDGAVGGAGPLRRHSQ